MCYDSVSQEEREEARYLQNDVGTELTPTWEKKCLMHVNIFFLLLTLKDVWMMFAQEDTIIL